MSEQTEKDAPSCRLCGKPVPDHDARLGEWPDGWRWGPAGWTCPECVTPSEGSER